MSWYVVRGQNEILLLEIVITPGPGYYRRPTEATEGRTIVRSSQSKIQNPGTHHMYLPTSYAISIRSFPLLALLESFLPPPLLLFASFKDAGFGKLISGSPA
jgi:hypothetical protein